MKRDPEIFLIRAEHPERPGAKLQALAISPKALSAFGARVFGAARDPGNARQARLARITALEGIIRGAEMRGLHEVAYQERGAPGADARYSLARLSGSGDLASALPTITAMLERVFGQGGVQALGSWSAKANDEAELTESRLSDLVAPDASHEVSAPAPRERLAPGMRA